jgi:hypothetical protein
MKARFTYFVLLHFFISFNILLAQPGNFGEPVIALHPEKSILFGFDSFINNQPQQNQRNAVICSAFNGWLYATYSYFDNNLYQDSFTILGSYDNGANWTVLFDGPFGSFQFGISKMDILACGNDTANIKLFVGLGIFDSLNLYHYVDVIRFDKNGVVELEILHNSSLQNRDFALASDDLYPANNSNPFSIGVVYSKGTNFKDSIVFCSSSNGGMSFDNRYEIASSSKYFDKVALAYGRSPSSSSGRYFAAWEEKDNASSTSGHIYTAHSEPNFNSSFTTPVLLDTLDPSSANKACNPVISCQNNGADNDSSNLTEVVLFEKYIPSTQKFNIGGFYNKKATVSNNFRKFTIDPSTSNKIQPDISFNAFDSTFMVTYFDSTAQKLPYYIHDFNMNNPDNWNLLSAGYNDDSNLVTPHPQMVMDFGKQMGANAWIGIRGGGNGAAMFDSPFTYYTGGSEINNNTGSRLVDVYPNPCNSNTTIRFELQKAEKVNISICNLVCQSVGIITDQSYQAGKHEVKCNIRNLSPGSYIVKFKAGDFQTSGKVTVIR